MTLQCEQCGNCCPMDCPDFVISQDDPRITSCKKHGLSSQPPGCRMFGPNYEFSLGVACRAGMKRALEMFPDLNFVLQVQPNGQVFYDDLLVPDDVKKAVSKE